jgi:DNA-binding CsgD family transcriptional regulator
MRIPVLSTQGIPWYLSWHTLLTFFILILSAFLLIIYMQKRIVNLLEERMNPFKRSATGSDRTSNTKETLANEAIFRSEIKELNKKLNEKSAILAAMAKESDEQRSLLIDLKTKFSELEDNPESLQSRIKEIQKMLETQINGNDDTYQIHFSEMNKQLYKKLKNEFPDLTTNDLRLCAYIRLNYSSKEIADLLSIKPSSVYISRSRLRKKLELGTEHDLLEFLNRFE